MTIIIALKDKFNDRVILASDRQSTTGQIKTSNVDKIVTITVDVNDGYNNTVRKDKIYIGISGYVFLINYLRYTFKAPPISEKQDFVDYLYNDFLNQLRTELTDKNLLGKREDVFQSESGMIIVHNGEIYDVYSRFSVSLVDEYAVTGSGWQLAIGSLYTNLHFHKKMDREDMVRQAIISCGVNTIYCDNNVNLKIIPI